MSLWSESVDPALGKLQQQVRTLDAAKANLQQTIASLQSELAEANSTHKEDVYRLQEVETRAVTAEEKLRKKTDELKQSLVQKSNSQQACLALEKQLKEEKDEVKRMTYELEVVSSRSNSAAPASRVAEEKAALERQVKQLSADLNKAEAALEKEKENATAKQSSQGTTSSSRTSISPADQANSQRNRFGFGAPGKGRVSLLPSSDPSATPARPSSALSSHSNIPAPSSSSAIPKHRRSSSFSGIPTSNTVATSSAPRIAQLERELTEAKAKVESAETDFLNVKTKLAGRERELLNIENRMMALERTKGEEIELLKNKLEDAFDDVAEKKQEAALIRDTLRGEMDKMVKEGREEKTSLLAKIERMKAELEKREAELERSEAGREEIEQQLGQAKEDDKLARGKISKNLEEAQAAKAHLERQVANLSTELKQEASKEAARERTEEELGSVRTELDEVRARTTKAIDDLRDQKEVAERALEAESSKRDTSSTNYEDKKRLEEEVEDVKQQLAAAEDRIKEFELKDVVDATEVEKVQQELREAFEGAEKVEEAKQALVEQVEAFEKREREWEEREKELSEAASGGQDELSAIKAELENLRTEMADNSSTEALTSELANVQAQLATKGIEIVDLTSRLASAEESHATALAKSREAVDAANSATERLDTTVSDLQRERDTLSSSLATLEAQLATITSELATSSAALEKAELLNATLESTILSLQQERDATVEDLTKVNAALVSLRADKEEADRLASVHQEELIALEDALQQRDAQITELEASANAQSSTPTRSFDDAHVEAVEKRLAQAEEHAANLSKQLGEMEEYESLRTEQRQELERKVEGMEQTIAELQEDLETLDNSSREDLAQAQEEADAQRRLAEEADVRLEQVEATVADKEATIVSLTDKNEQLESTIVDLELSSARLSKLEDSLAAANAELDALRSTSEEGSLAAMQEASDLQSRITAQENEIDDLKHQLTAIDTLRLTLSNEQEKVATLSHDLTRVKEEASAADLTSTDRLAALTTRAERAEEDLHRLRSKLDETTARLVDSKDLLAQTQADLQFASSSDSSPVPSPTTPTSSTDASILVSRLREERDDLRSRLDFARTEAAYRVQALQERLKETEDAKAKEVSAMEVQLVERTAELGAEREGRIAAEEREQEAEKDVQALDDELARAEEKVREVEIRLEELTASLQAELDESHQALDASSREVTTFREAAEESQLALAEATARVQELEEALKAANDRLDDQPAISNPEMVDLCASLQKEVAELQARVLRRTETIGRHEQTIAQLQNRLADSDDEDDADTAEIAPQVSKIAADATELANAKAQLEEEEHIRADLEEQLHLVTEDLDEVREQLSSSRAAREEAERELQAALDAEAVLDDQLRDVTTHLEEVEAAHEALQADYDALVPRHEELDAAHQDLKARLDTLQLAHSEALHRVGSLEDDLSETEERHAEALGELESARASFEALRPSLSIMEARLEDAITEKHALEQQVVEKEDVVANLRRSVLTLEEAKIKLARDLEAATNVVQSSSVDAGKSAEMEEELEGLRASLAAAEGKFAEAQASREVLEASHAAEYEALEKELEIVVSSQTGDEEELTRVKGELASASTRTTELDTLRAEAQQALEVAQQNVTDLTSRLSTTETDLLEAKTALDTSTSTLAFVQQQLDEQVAAGQRREEEAAALQERLSSTSIDLTAAQEESRQRIAQLEEELTVARSELADTLQAMDANEQGWRVEMDEVTRRLEHLNAEKNELFAALSQAQDDVAGLKAKLEDSSRGSAQVELLETQLHEAQREIEGLGELVQSERDALKVQKEAVGKVESAKDAAMRENKTLRALARGAEGEVEALKGENARLDKVAAALEQDNLALDARLREIEETSQAHLTELLDTLQIAEERKAEVERQVVVLEQQIGELEASLAAAPSSQQADTTELEETIKELSQQLEAKAAEVEDTDEKYMEVLKSQKRHLSQIERLKAKISSLQRDLTNAKAAAAPPPPTTPAPAPPLSSAIAPISLASTEPPSAGKKRQAPQDFDPLPSATATPRAIVALTSRTPSSTQKENTVSRPRSDSASKRKPAPSADGLIPLKPAAISPPPREALKVVESNGAATAMDTAKPSKVDELRARLAAQRQARPKTVA